MMRAVQIYLIALLFLCIYLPPATAAEPQTELDVSKDTVLTARDVTYDRENEQVKASGNVEIVQGDRILKADRVIYDVSAASVRAEGNVVLLEPNGNVLFADEMDLQDELKTGAIHDLRILFSDNSRLAAHDAIKVDENRTVMTKAVFSTCEPCEEDPDRSPIWQVKAGEVIHDRDDKTITYKNAVLEFFGVPVFYTPYFSHPDPSVKRESGFLAPTIFNSSTLGRGVKIPYYYVISDDKDMTFAPTFTTKEGVQLAGEYRQAVKSGAFKFDSSLTYIDERTDNNVKTGEKEFQGHIRGDGLFKINPTWDWGFDIFRTNNDTYLTRYDISDEDTLTSTAFLHGQRGRNFSSLRAYSFQGLREDDVSSQTPVVPAWFDYSYVGEPNEFGARFSANADTLMVYRDDGQDTNRVSLEGGWHVPYTTANGQVLTFDSSLRGDVYYTRDQLSDPYDPSSKTDEDSFSGRVIPSVSVKWKYPFVRQSGTIRQTVEPIVEAVWAEALGDTDTPNEDSISFEFDDTNLFGSNRYAGLDEVEEGGRINYGLNLGVYQATGGYSTLLVGQSIHIGGDTGFQDGTGLEDQFSDYVTRFEIRPSEYLQFINRARFGHDRLKLARNEVSLHAGTSDYWFDLGYVYLRDDPNGITQDKREEVYVTGKVKLAKYWNAYGSYRRDLVGTGNSIAGLFGLEYLDECFGFAFEAKRSFTRDRDVEPETRFGIKIRLLPFN
ncbi:LPS-assembly protein LptD [Sneathiella sp.]|uniref:LPS-assembly protein LptD n=1 Tax=Sneathiella sp. TaxID=1964365 RepID=UPI00356AF54D